MDNSVENSFSTPEGRAYATPIGAGVAGCVGGAILVVAAIAVSSDPAGTVLMGIAGVLLLCMGAYTLTIRPRLVIGAGTPPTLTIRSLGGRRTYPIDRVERIRLLSMRRVGRRVGQLEIDLVDAEDAPALGTPDRPGDALRDDTRLVVFSRWDLGADLLEVVDELRRVGFRVDDARP